MKTAVLVNQSTGYLTVDICNAFAKQYDKVVLLAGRIETFSRKLSDNIQIVYICPYDKSSIARRLKTWIKGSLKIKKYLSSLDESVDILYFTNPPMSYLWADKMKHRFGIVEYDIYPDALRNVKCPSVVMKWWAKRNREIFRKSVGIITLSNGMKEQLTKYVEAKKIKVIYNWGANEDRLKVNAEDNIFAKKFNLNDKFVVMYSGNIGYTHNVETIIDVAIKCKDNSNIIFLIIGEGGKKSTLMKKANDEKLDNVIFSDYLPVEDVKYSMSCANLGVVTLTDETAKVSVPSKTYNLLSYAIPLLSIAPKESELGKVIKEYKCGGSFEKDNVDGIVKFIEGCISDKSAYNELIVNAKIASSKFTYKNADSYPLIFKR
ncbi:MAG: glycosyltransferase family 4 protein [Muribaculaceae bacterium]|nr:glycosyltransferase family 4 protein [Muribaculaceae bacterium]